MGNVIVILIILAIVAVAIAKIVIEKKRGAKCIGCPHGRGSSSCSCNHSDLKSKG
ncbi:MAG TPA: FeoB-associated Cys-rich membrane protein [Pseudobacteroides sp.]|nr:FeoB-associated Cys-rich membrane protein [Pseudobacteroides sp.]